MRPRSFRISPKLRFAAVVAVASSAFVASPASAAETLKLDTAGPSNGLFWTGAHVKSSALIAGQPYVVTVSGTATIWDFGSGDGPICGVAESGPLEPSPGKRNQLATWDAATVFAAPRGFEIAPLGGACTTGPQLPASQSALQPGFQISNGIGFQRPVPYGGPRSVPRTDHTYSYELTAAGGPIDFRFLDEPAADNSGIFTITIRTADECAKISCLGSAGVLSDTTSLPVKSVDPGSIGVLGTRVCNLDRVLSIRLKRGNGAVSFAKTVYFLNGKRARSVSGRAIFIGRTDRIRAQKFRRLPDGRLRVTVLVTTSNGQKATLRRTVERCNPRIKARSVKFS